MNILFQWQYKEAMQFVLWVAQKIDLQAWRAFSIFKFTKLKSYDKNNIQYIFIPNIFPTTYNLKNE
jgi:hypothetical protein